ncbi:MAG: hypothetical protein QNJ77_02305 [Acidimicrobiia bacterium]|nr:hypothetical protein [Acidimicrobiia bacterium]
MSKEDPKHGRWILPLVVLALVAFTYTFVNNLPAAETVVSTTLAAETTTTTTEPPEETTTTTLPEEVMAFISTADSLGATAAQMRTDAQTINDEYPDVTGYGATRDLLSALKADTTAFVEDVDEVVVPAAAAEKWSDVTTSAAAMEQAADDMLDGLVNTSGSEKRLGALEDYNIAAATFDQALDAAKDAATEG